VGWFWRAQIAVLEASARLENAQKWAEQARTLARTYRGQVSVPREIPEFLVLVAEADALKMQGRLSEAHEKYQTALRARPNHPVVENQLNFLRTEAAKVLKGRSAGTPQITLRPVVADPRRAPNS
jgi:tetratricopeptide (TPR) repeat protein